jgi:hypothetical protein
MVPYTPEAAQSLCSETHLTKRQYTKIRSQAHTKNCNTFRRYYATEAPKEEYSIYPKICGTSASETASIIQITFWTIFRNNSLQFQNGVAMKALDAVSTSNDH